MSTGKFPVKVYHHLHSPIHPSLCDDQEDLDRLLADGWTTSYGGLPTPSPAESEYVPPRNADGLRTDGPTFEEYVAAGYEPEHYPPQDYEEKPSAGLDEFRATEGNPCDSFLADPEDPDVCATCGFDAPSHGDATNESTANASTGSEGPNFTSDPSVRKPRKVKVKKGKK